MEYKNDHSADAPIIPTFYIDFYKWSCSKFSLEKFHLSLLVPFFPRKIYVQNKHRKKQNQNKVNEAKAVGNIKYEPILSHLALWFQYRGW